MTQTRSIMNGTSQSLTRTSARYQSRTMERPRNAYLKKEKYQRRLPSWSVVFLTVCTVVTGICPLFNGIRCNNSYEKLLHSGGVSRDVLRNGCTREWYKLLTRS